MEAFADKNDFRFYCKPYYLRLNLPGDLNGESESSKYDVDENTFKFKYLKCNQGENFEGLDLITKLLTAPSSTNKAKQLIEEVANDDDDDNEEDDDEEDSNKWFIEQFPNENNADSDEIKLTSTTSYYGFALTKSNVFTKLSVITFTFIN